MPYFPNSWLVDCLPVYFLHVNQQASAYKAVYNYLALINFSSKRHIMFERRHMLQELLFTFFYFIFFFFFMNACNQFWSAVFPCGQHVSYMCRKLQLIQRIVRHCFALIEHFISIKITIYLKQLFIPIFS